MLIFAIGVGTFLATLLGGLFALRFKDKLHLITGFSAGAVIGVAFFDLLPEAEALRSPLSEFSSVSLMMGIGFVAYMLLDRTVVLNSHDENGCENPRHRGTIGAASLCLHSLFDGVLIGLAFQISVPIGVIVTIAILTHDFSDGINTVNMILKSGSDRRTALRWLALDAFAPVVGIASTFFYSLPSTILGSVLALFCGFFIYIGASELLPESHHGHPRMLTTLATLLGISVLYIAIHFAKG
jgi:zinc transporter ZupT